MARRRQATRLQRSLGEIGERLERWADNPWRRLSVFTITPLLGFLLGTAVSSVAGVLGQLDPVMALVVVLGSESMIRLRRRLNRSEQRHPSILMIGLDFVRIGFLYGLFLEAFKLF
jgi:hypothetical protein